MITVLTGDDTFSVAETVSELASSYAGVVEKIDGSRLELRDVPDLFMGQSLFSEERLIIIDSISRNARVWEKLPEWLPRIPANTHIVLVEEKIDKRTSTYKSLKEYANLQEFLALTPRDSQRAEKWCDDRAHKLGVKLDRGASRHIVQRVGVDTWTLAKTLDILVLLDGPVTIADIDRYIVPSTSENIFSLFEAAISGNARRVHELIDAFEVEEDPHALFALLSSQVVQLLALAYAKPGDNPEKDFSLHPFVASKMKQQASRLGTVKVAAIGRVMARADADMKHSKADPWVLIERALLDVTQL